MPVLFLTVSFAEVGGSGEDVGRLHQVCGSGTPSSIFDRLLITRYNTCIKTVRHKSLVMLNVEESCVLFISLWKIERPHSVAEWNVPA